MVINQIKFNCHNETKKIKWNVFIKNMSTSPYCNYLIIFTTASLEIRVDSPKHYLFTRALFVTCIRLRFKTIHLFAGAGHMYFGF